MVQFDNRVLEYLVGGADRTPYLALPDLRDVVTDQDKVRIHRSRHRETARVAFAEKPARTVTLGRWSAGDDVVTRTGRELMTIILLKTVFM